MEYGQSQNQEPQDDIQPKPQGTPPTPEPTPIPDPAPMPTPMQAPKKRFTSQAIIITILSLLLLVTVGALGYVLLYQNDDSSSNATTTDTSEKKTETEESVKVETPEIKDEYEGWKTFPQDAQSLADGEIDLTYREWAKSEFRFPANWKLIPVVGDARCNFVMGHVVSGDIVNGPEVEIKGGAMCIGDEFYNSGQTIDTVTSSLLANGDWVTEKEATVDSTRAITLARIKSIPPDAGGKLFYTYIDNIESNGSMNVGTVVGCLPSGNVAEREAFLKDCELAIDSIKLQ